MGVSESYARKLCARRLVPGSTKIAGQWRVSAAIFSSEMARRATAHEPIELSRGPVAEQLRLVPVEHDEIELVRGGADVIPITGDALRVTIAADEPES
jgi:hypothetical protein